MEKQRQTVIKWKEVMMRKFDTKVQYLKYKVLKEIARYAFENKLNVRPLKFLRKSYQVLGQQCVAVFTKRAIV